MRVKITHIPRELDIAEVAIQLSLQGTSVEIPNLEEPTIVIVKNTAGIKKLASVGIVIEIPEQ